MKQARSPTFIFWGRFQTFSPPLRLANSPDARSIELLSRMKPYLKIMLSETDLNSLQGTEANYKRPLNRAFLYITIFTYRTKCPIIYLWPGMVLRSPTEGKI
ncbi:hypothetical protein EKL85_21645 [Salmonella enterica subsp. enterica serovar Give]|nr:hypothetical protein [Salmonella enterica subsp. enterica serovar Give]ECA4141886.1 hypothetical protein [Salmonella enterica subsp. enterica serovar Give]